MIRRPLLLLVLFTATLFSYSENESLKALQKKFNSLEDFSADFKQTAAGSINGKVFYKKSDKYRLEMNTNIMVSNGESVWNYNKKENKVFIKDANEKDINSFSFNSIINDFPNKCTVTSEKDGNQTVIILTPAQGEKVMFKKVRLWMNSDNLLSKAEILLGKSPMVFEFTNYKLNQNLKESVFTYTAPKGTQVVDLRK